jgi:hypothetical protein
MNSTLNKSNKSIQYNNNNEYNIQLNYGLKDINGTGGGNFTFVFKSPVKFAPFFYLP